MPELPEVETIRRGIAPLVEGRIFAGAVVRVPTLRWPIPADLAVILRGERVVAVERRAKYLLLRCTRGCAILHLGMTGHLRLVTTGAPPAKHDHVDLEFTDGSCLRLNDPRRFGALLWTTDPHAHVLLRDLGPEPFADAIDGDYFHRLAKGRRGPIKSFIMDQTVIVGVGNIYASEALFRAGIHPATAAGRIGVERLHRLSAAIRQVLSAAIDAGGTTIRDFADPEGRLGYFRLQLEVYGREGEPCRRCGRPVRALRLGGRSTYFCPECQR
jgi:formamidopyrimidine-DNA glycosylase